MEVYMGLTILGVVIPLLILITVYYRTTRTSTVLGPWHGCCESNYIYAFRERINIIARKLYLPKEWADVRVRFNPRETCAEFYLLKDNCVFVRIHVHGECGRPEEVIVFSDLSDDLKSLFLSLEEPEVNVVFKSYNEWKQRI